MNKLVKQARMELFEDVVDTASEHTLSDEQTRRMEVLAGKSLLPYGKLQNVSVDVLSASLWYASALLTDEDVTQQKASNLFGVSVQAVRNRYRDVLELESDFQRGEHYNLTCPDCDAPDMLPRFDSSIKPNPPETISYENFVCRECGESKTWSVSLYSD